jgi:hypothetical protein
MQAKMAAFRAEHPQRVEGKGRGEGMKAMLDAFKGDTFTPTTQAKPEGSDERMGDRRLGFLEVVVPVLTPAQRTTLAEELRTGEKL